MQNLRTVPAQWRPLNFVVVFWPEDVTNSSTSQNESLDQKVRIDILKRYGLDSIFLRGFSAPRVWVPFSFGGHWLTGYTAEVRTIPKIEIQEVARALGTRFDAVPEDLSLHLVAPAIRFLSPLSLLDL